MGTSKALPDNNLTASPNHKISQIRGLKRQTTLLEHPHTRRVKQEVDSSTSTSTSVEDDEDLPSVQQILEPAYARSNTVEIGQILGVEAFRRPVSPLLTLGEEAFENDIDRVAAASLPVMRSAHSTTTSGSLRAVIAVSRLSDRWGPSKGEMKLAGLDTRNGQLNDLVVEGHQQQHNPCSCKPERYKITLNGVPSNTFATADASYSHRWKELFDVLTRLSSTADQREVVLTVSSPDGLFTNVYGFLAFFAPFLQLNLTYHVYDKSRPKAYTIIELFSAINDVLQQRGNDDAHNLVRDWIRIGYAKMHQTLGITSVKSIVQYSRNKSAVKAEPSQNVRASSATRVTRVVRAGGTDFEPQYNMQEESRVERPKLGGLILCPTCPERFANLEELVLHLIKEILALPEDQRRCPLCPPPYASWTYIFVIDGIYHLFRHLSPANPYQVQSKRMCQCPYCFLLLGSASKFAEHLEHIHLRILQIRHVAVTSGFINAANASSIDDVLLSDMTIRNKSEIMSLPDLFHTLADIAPSVHRRTLRWTTITTADEDYIPTGIPLPDVPPFARVVSPPTRAPSTPNPTTGSLQPGFATITTQPQAVARSEIATRVREMKYATAGTENFSGLGVGLARRLNQVFLQLNTDGLILCCLLDEWQVCGCGAHFESVTKLCEHIYDVLNSLDSSKRCCPWCPGQTIIFKPANPDVVPGSHQSRRKANKPSDRSNDVRHLLGHFPPDLKCLKCDYSSRTRAQMDSHIQLRHKTFICEGPHCRARFETAEELQQHQRKMKH